eukprot:CAMPEP_0114654256 /NCGR_PEP_ID=MMETSP0191-20121206/10367_1 /TAXON_ID=126664 /ORGANISM="Sorites sp." /LENGTH=57 /DNA_ID=CAMNT_0001869699 /DNA_START=335 /DNA_END=508 /DNA_ORIENTATION=+
MSPNVTTSTSLAPALRILGDVDLKEDLASGDVGSLAMLALPPSHTISGPSLAFSGLR